MSTAIPETYMARAVRIIDRHRDAGCDLHSIVALAIMETEQGVHAPRLGLTQKQQLVLKFIQDCETQEVPAPTYDEIAKACALSSKSQVHAIIQRLRERGAITGLPGRARSISITAIGHVSTAHKNSVEA